MEVKCAFWVNLLKLVFFFENEFFDFENNKNKIGVKL